MKFPVQVELTAELAEGCVIDGDAVDVNFAEVFVPVGFGYAIHTAHTNGISGLGDRYAFPVSGGIAVNVSEGSFKSTDRRLGYELVEGFCSIWILQIAVSMSHVERTD